MFGIWLPKRNALPKKTENLGENPPERARPVAPGRWTGRASRPARAGRDVGQLCAKRRHFPALARDSLAVTRPEPARRGSLAGATTGPITATTSGGRWVRVPFLVNFPLLLAEAEVFAYDTSSTFLVCSFVERALQ